MLKRQLRKKVKRIQKRNHKKLTRTMRNPISNNRRTTVSLVHVASSVTHLYSAVMVLLHNILVDKTLVFQIINTLQVIHTNLVQSRVRARALAPAPAQILSEDLVQALVLVLDQALAQCVVLAQCVAPAQCKALAQCKAQALAQCKAQAQCMAPVRCKVPAPAQ